MIDNQQPGTSNEWRWFITVTIIALAFASLPYIVGFTVSTPEIEFGGMVYNQEDYNHNLAKMLQGRQGIFAYRLLHSPEPHQGLFYPPFYMLLGHLSRLTGLSILATYTLARFFFGLVMLLTIYWFISLFARRRSIRRTAFILTTFSSGLGWLMLLLFKFGPGDISPIDFWLTDAYPFFTLMTFPHFCLDLSAALWTMGCAVQYHKKNRLGYLIGMTLAALIVVNIHALTLLICGLTLLGFAGLTWQQEKRLPWRLIRAMFLAFILPALLVLYLAVAVSNNPVLNGFMDQNFTLSPPPIYYVTGLGLVFFLAIPGAILAIRRRNTNRQFLLIWLMVVALLVYAPFSMQRRLVVGVHVALSVLAADGVVDWFKPSLRQSRFARWLDNRWRYPPERLAVFTTNLLLAICAMSNIYMVTGYTVAAAARNPMLFHSGDQNAALDWLAKNSGPDDTILSGYDAGNYIPARTGHRVFLGHTMETVDYGAKSKLVDDFFTGIMSDQDAKTLFADYGIQYIYLGPDERKMGGNLADKPYLAHRFTSGDVSVYQVIVE